MEANRDDTSGDLFGKLKADVRVTTQPRKRSVANALRILSVTGVRILPETLFTCRAQRPPAVCPRYRPRDRCAVGARPTQKEGRLKLIARQPRTHRRRRPRHCDRVKRLRGWVERGWSGDASNDASEFWRKNIQDGRSVHFGASAKLGKARIATPPSFSQTCEINGFVG
jgi:hypothetical protein